VIGMSIHDPFDDDLQGLADAARTTVYAQANLEDLRLVGALNWSELRPPNGQLATPIRNVTCGGDGVTWVIAIASSARCLDF